MSRRFVLTYVSVISVALFGSIYASYLWRWNRVAFAFPSEVQKIVNGTTIIEVQWRQLGDTFEMMVRINDGNDMGEFPVSHYLGVLFDSDHNGRFSTEENEFEDDHCAYIALNGSGSINRVVGKVFGLGNLSRAHF